MERPDVILIEFHLGDILGLAYILTFIRYRLFAPLLSQQETKAIHHKYSDIVEI